MRLSGAELRALAFIVPLAALAGCVAAYKLRAPEHVVQRGFDLVGLVTHVRAGDTIEVSGVPVRIANLDCEELGTAAGNHAHAMMRRWAARATASCQLEGRMIYDRQVGVGSIDGVGDLREAMIRRCRADLFAFRPRPRWRPRR